MGISGHNTSIKAVAFDLDGTFYPNYRFYIRNILKFLLHPFFYTAFIKVRRILHSFQYDQAQILPFYDRQASLLADYLGKEPGIIRKKADILIYGGLKKLFSGVKLFPHLKEVLSSFREAGLRLAVLSDFPPDEKLSILGLDSFFDVVISSEETGALKPSGIPFSALIGQLALEPGEIIYVGNSMRFDVEGSKSAGMKAALIRRGTLSTGHIPEKTTGKADFVFRDYRQLQEYILR